MNVQLEIDLPLILSLLGAITGVLGFVRANKLRRFDYLPRMHLISNGDAVRIRSISDRGEKHAFSYSGELVNMGMNTIRIDEIWIEYGAIDKYVSRSGIRIFRNTYLSQSVNIRIAYNVPWPKVDRYMQDNNVNECHYFLRIAYENVDGKIVNAEKLLGQHDESGSQTHYSGSILEEE